MTLYIGNLSFETTEEDLSDLFTQVGPINSLNLVKDRYTGKSRGFAFLEFSDSNAGETAISQFDGFKVSGRNLIVNEAIQKAERRSSNQRTRH